MRGKYLVRNPWLNAVLRIVDAALRVACLGYFGRQNSSIGVPRRILLANGAHLGDVLLFSSAIAAVKSAFPEAQIGVAVGAWATPIVSSNPLVSWVHVVDHWKLNRSSLSLFGKLVHYARTRSRALKEIRRVQYDVTIDFYYYFPNFIPLLWQAGIPIRIGYGSGGFGPLLTHEVSWRNLDCHVLDYHRALLGVLNVPHAIREKMSPALSPIEPAVEQRTRSLLVETGNAPGEYVVMHMGSGHSQKEWPLASWRRLAEEFLAEGRRLVFTGIGDYEERNIRSVIDGLQHSTNLCSRLSWSEYVAVLSYAHLIVCVDSLAGHLAAAADIPCVVIRTGISHPVHWRPLAARGEALSAPVNCSPCYRSEGCSTMRCVREVPVSLVYDTGKLLTNDSRKRQEPM